MAEVNSHFSCGKTSTLIFFHVAFDYFPIFFKFNFQALSPVRSFLFFLYALQSLVFLKCFKMLDHPSRVYHPKLTDILDGYFWVFLIATRVSLAFFFLFRISFTSQSVHFNSGGRSSCVSYTKQNH